MMVAWCPRHQRYEVHFRGADGRVARHVPAVVGDGDQVVDTLPVRRDRR